MKSIIFCVGVIFSLQVAAQYAPAANMSGTTAIHKDSSVIVGWATSVASFQRGLEDIVNGFGPTVSYGDSTAALGYAEGTSSNVVSLGDAGEIVLAFDFPIMNESGPDFAVFENSFSHDYLEFAHVEVSTDGQTFVRIPSISVIQTDNQTGTYSTTLTNWVHNLAGKYIQGYGTPFDLEDLVDSLGVNLDSINYVKIIDVIGTINSAYGSFDSQGTIINEPYPSAFASGGFDLDAVAVINENNIFAGIELPSISINVYPNPFIDELFVNGYQGAYQLLDLSGRIYAKGVVENESPINLADVRSGVYLLQLGDVVKRVVVE